MSETPSTPAPDDSGNPQPTEPKTAIPGADGPQHDLIPPGRGGGIIAIAAIIIAALAIFLLFRRGWYGGVDERNPPSLMAVNLAFCALIMSALAIYRARGVAGQRPTRIAAAVAIVIGMSGPVIAVCQVIHWKKSTEFGELDRVSQIAKKAKAYAQAHGNKYPTSLAVMICADPSEPWYLNPDALHSPFRANRKPMNLAMIRSEFPTNPAEAERLVMESSHYVYLGNDLPGKEKYEMQMDAPKIIVAASKQDSNGMAAFDRRLGERIPIAWANGEAKFVDAKDLDPYIKDSNAARADRELPPMDAYGRIQKK
jgi:hypothetical protein